MERREPRGAEQDIGPGGAGDHRHAAPRHTVVEPLRQGTVDDHNGLVRAIAECPGQPVLPQHARPGVGRLALGMQA